MIPSAPPPAPDLAARLEAESRTWGMLAHLCILANMWVPFGGLIGTMLIYSLRKFDDDAARRNERSALNFEITLALFYFLVFAAYLAIGFTLPHGEFKSTTVPPPWQIFAFFGIAGVVVLIGLGATVCGCLAARRAWLGRPYRYPFSIEFVKG